MKIKGCGPFRFTKHREVREAAEAKAKDQKTPKCQTVQR